MLDRPSDPEAPMATKANPFYADLGQRIAERRKAAGVTQVQLAEQLGIAQQTMAHYEGGVSRIPVDVLTQVADQLGVSVEDLIGVRAKRSTGKRGPAPKLQQQLERIQSLPAAKQRAIVQVLDSVLAAHQ